MIVLFDLNGTLTDTEPIGEALGASEAGELVLYRAVRSAFVDALTGVYRPFTESSPGCARATWTTGSSPSARRPSHRTSTRQVSRIWRHV